jgi:hypothetical protein
MTEPGTASDQSDEIEAGALTMARAALAVLTQMLGGPDSKRSHLAVVPPLDSLDPQLDAAGDDEDQRD